jgi:hypothetical protein
MTSPLVLCAHPLFPPTNSLGDLREVAKRRREDEEREEGTSNFIQGIALADFRKSNYRQSFASFIFTAHNTEAITIVPSFADAVKN